MTYHQVDTCELLTKLTQTAEEGTPEVLRRTICEQFAVLESASSALDIEGLLDTIQLGEYIRVVQFFAQQPGNHIVALFGATFHQEPAR